MRLELISNHAPRMGSDVELSHDLAVDLFQPTLPVWGATTFASPPVSCGLFQPTLPVWGATPVLLTILIEHPISTHAPRMGSDGISPQSLYRYMKFQPTLPVWGATANLNNSFCANLLK